MTPEEQPADQAIAGPTHAPWVDSNGWVPLLVHGIAPGKKLWLEIALPKAKGMLPAEKYCLAVAESRAYGCRWMIDLDDVMRAGLADRDLKAMEAWKKISAI